MFCMLKLQRFLFTMYLWFGLKMLKSLSKSFDNILNLSIYDLSLQGVCTKTAWCHLVEKSK